MTVFDVTPKSVWIRIAYIFRLAVPVKTGWIKRSFLFCSVLLKGLLCKYQRKGPWKPIVEPTYALTRILPSDWPTCTWQSKSLLRLKMYFFFSGMGTKPQKQFPENFWESCGWWADLLLQPCLSVSSPPHWLQSVWKEEPTCEMSR